jgi:hypothetical protein
MRPMPLLVTLMLAPIGALAQSAQEVADDTVRKAAVADQATQGCVDIQIDGQWIRDYECLGRALAPVVSPSHSRALPHLHSDGIARRPPTELGIVTPEATRQRMGNTFGKSTLPQRPQQVPPTLPPAIRRP